MSDSQRVNLNSEDILSSAFSGVGERGCGCLVTGEQKHYTFLLRNFCKPDSFP